ncbi:MAG: gliding motility-associated C-terminal domain-containing protein [Bacteroidota bacterium]|nr:gliding motility-associated C-terminal domain-containing protein [Bacteroidota bacterium]
MKKSICFLIFLLCTLSLDSFSQNNWLQGAGGNANDEALDVVHDASGNIYSTGYFSQSARFDNMTFASAGMSDVFISKQDSLGKFLWVSTAGGLMDEKGVAISLNSSGEIFITGMFRSSAQFGSTTLNAGGSSQDIFIAKLNNSGSFVWAQSYGAADTELATDIVIDATGNIVVSGQFKGITQFGSFPFTSTNYPLTMPILGGTPSFDAFIFKTNTSGTVTWAKQGAAEYDDRITKLAVDNSSNIYACGQFSDTIAFTSTYSNNAFNAGLLMKLDPAGNETWFRRILATQFMIYDMKFAQARLWLTGDFQGTLVYLGTPNNYLSNTYTNKIFVLKVETGSGNYLDGASEGSNNVLSARALAIDAQQKVYSTGYFKCSFTPFSATHGNGVFYSSGYKDIFVIKYDSLLTRTWEKQYGGIGDDYPTAMSIHYNDQPLFAGSYTKNFNAPDGNNFYLHVNNQSTTNSNNGSVICGNSLYGKFVTQKGYGNKDILITRPVDAACPLYDYFERIHGTCTRDTLMPNRYPFGDTLTACDKQLVYITTPTTVDSLQAPEWSYSWSGGLTNDSVLITSTGWYTISYGYADNCRQFVDSFYVIIYPTPGIPVITAYNAISFNAIPVGACLYKSSIIAGDTALFVASGITPGYPFVWMLPDGSTISNIDSIYVTMPGTYILKVTNPGGGCNSGTCRTLFVYSTSGPGSLPANPIIVFTDSVFNATDTVKVCSDKLFEMQLVDSASFYSGSASSIGTFVTWTLAGGFAFKPFDSYVNTFGDHTQNFLAVSSGNCSVTADIIDPITGLVFASITRNFYLDMYTPPSNIPLVGGTLFFCPGDTLPITASGGDNYIWSGPGIVSTNSPVNDSVFINLLGDYNLSSTTIDPVLGCSLLVNTLFTVSSIPSPIVTMNPAHGTICPFDSVYLSAEPGTSYTWYGPTGSVLSTAQNLWVSTPGIYYYTYMSTSGCLLVSEMVEVLEYSTPYIDPYPGISLCANGSVILNVETNENALITWAAPFSGSALTQVADTAGTYSVSVTFCSITTVANIVVVPASGPSVDIIYSGNDTICAQDTIVLMGTNGFTDYTWFPSAEGQLLITNGGGSFSLQAINIEGCYSSDSITIYEYPAVAPPATTDTTVCAGTFLTIHATASGNLFWYDDLYGGELTGTGDSITVFIDKPVTYFVSNFNGQCYSELMPLNVNVFSGSQIPLIDGDMILCEGDSMILSVADLLSGANYFWNGPGISAVNDTQLIVSPATELQEGYYSVTAYSSTCINTSDSVLVQVNTINLNAFSSSSYTICQYDSALIYGDTLIGSYTWNTGETADSISAGTAGIYYYTYTDSAGCSEASDTTTLIVLPAPLSVALADTSVCAGTPLTFTATSDTTLSVSWYNGLNVLIATGASYTTPPLTQATMLLVQLTGANGCAGITDTVQITILPPIASPLLSVSDSVCAGDSVQLMATNLAGYTFFWSGPSGFTSSSVSPVINPFDANASGVYSLYVMNGYCMSDTATVEILAIPYPSLIVTNNYSICIGDDSTLSAVSNAWNILWSNGLTTPVINIAPLETTLYTVQASNMCGTVIQNILVTVNPLPIVNINSGFTLIIGETGQLSASNGVTYNWFPSEGLSCTTCSSPYVTLVHPQDYYVTVTDSNQCTNYDSVSIDVTDVSVVYIPNAFTPNGDGSNDVFKVAGNHIESVHMQIFNRWGEKVFESKEISEGWDGTFKGKVGQSETYVYKIIVKLNIESEERTYDGTVTLVK